MRGDPTLVLHELEPNPYQLRTYGFQHYPCENLHNVHGTRSRIDGCIEIGWAIKSFIHFYHIFLLYLFYYTHIYYTSDGMDFKIRCQVGELRYEFLNKHMYLCFSQVMLKVAWLKYTVCHRPFSYCLIIWRQDREFRNHSHRRPQTFRNLVGDSFVMHVLWLILYFRWLVFYAYCIKAFLKASPYLHFRSQAQLSRNDSEVRFPT